MKKSQNSHKSFNTDNLKPLKPRKPRIPQKTAQISKCLNISIRVPSSVINNAVNVSSMRRFSVIGRVNKANIANKANKVNKAIETNTPGKPNPCDICLICSKERDLLQTISYSNDQKDQKDHSTFSKFTTDNGDNEDVKQNKQKQKHVGFKHDTDGSLTSAPKSSTLLSCLLRKMQSSTFTTHADVEEKKTYFKRKWIDILLTVFNNTVVCKNTTVLLNNTAACGIPQSSPNFKSNMKDKIFGRGVELAKRVPIEFLVTCDYVDFRQTIEDYLLHRRNDLNQVTSELNDLVFLVNFTDYVDIYNDLAFYRQFYRNFLAKYKISFTAKSDEEKRYQRYQRDQKDQHNSHNSKENEKNRNDGHDGQISYISGSSYNISDHHAQHATSIFGLHGYSTEIQSVPCSFPCSFPCSISCSIPCQCFGNGVANDTCVSCFSCHSCDSCLHKRTDSKHNPNPSHNPNTNPNMIEYEIAHNVHNIHNLHNVHNECATFTTVFSRYLPSEESNDISTIKTIAKRIAMQNKLYFVRFFTEVLHRKQTLPPPYVHTPILFNDRNKDKDRDTIFSVQDLPMQNLHQQMHLPMQNLPMQMSTKMSQMLHRMKEEEPTMKQARLEHFKPLIHSLNYILDYNIWDIIFDYVSIYTFFHFPLGIQALCHDMLMDPEKQQTQFEKSYRSLQLSKGLLFL